MNWAKKQLEDWYRQKISYQSYLSYNFLSLSLSFSLSLSLVKHRQNGISAYFFREMGVIFWDEGSNHWRGSVKIFPSQKSVFWLFVSGSLLTGECPPVIKIVENLYQSQKIWWLKKFAKNYSEKSRNSFITQLFWRLG